MANITPFFITGANCKLKVNGVTLAFATNLSYTVSVPHAKLRMLGSYEANSLEPLSYDVNGSFTIIRYISDLKNTLEQSGFSSPSGVSDSGNGVGSWSQLGSKSAAFKAFNNMTDGRADQSLNPSSLQDGVTFDIEIYQKLPNDESSGVSRLRNARIVQMSTQVNKRGNMTQTFQFFAQYLDEDSFIADRSAFSKR